jgi:hypothetical protein
LGYWLLGGRLRKRVGDNTDSGLAICDIYRGDAEVAEGRGVAGEVEDGSHEEHEGSEELEEGGTANWASDGRRSVKGIRVGVAVKSAGVPATSEVRGRHVSRPRIFTNASPGERKWTTG